MQEDHRVKHNLNDDVVQKIARYPIEVPGCTGRLAVYGCFYPDTAQAFVLKSKQSKLRPIRPGLPDRKLRVLRSFQRLKGGFYLSFLTVARVFSAICHIIKSMRLFYYRLFFLFLLTACQPTGALNFAYDGAQQAGNGSSQQQSQHQVSWSLPTGDSDSTSPEEEASQP